MKITFIIKRLHNASGGAERVLADVAAGLAGRRHDVSILSFDYPGQQSFYPLNPQIRWVQAAIGDPSRPSRLSETIRRMRYIRAFVKREKPDCVIAFMHSAFVPAVFSLIGARIPVIASEHIVPAHYKTRPMEFLFLVLAALMVRGMTVVGEGVRMLYPSIIRSRITVIYNPVSPDIFMAAPEAGKSRVILNIGRLEPQKDQSILIRAFSLLSKDYPDWVLRIAGEGTLRPALEKQIEGSGLSGRVALIGAIRDIAREYAGAGIFALSSRYESFGMATAEAMASGLPVVGFADCSGTNELVRNGETGFLVSPHTAEAFAAALKALMDDADLRRRMGGAGRRALAPYALENVVKDWENLISRCIQNPDKALSDGS